MPGLRRVLRLGLSAAAAALLAGAAFAWTLQARANLAQGWPVGDDPSISAGEQLLHGLSLPYEQKVTFRMPLAGLFDALLFEHADAGLRLFWLLLVGASFAALAFALGSLLHSSAVGLLCAAGVLWASRPFAFAELGETYYALFLLLCAATLAWRALTPGTTTAFLLGASVGLSLLLRSPLAFLPPLLAALELARLKRRWREAWRELLLIGVLPYLFLAPWVLLNLRLESELVLFENGAADANLVTGALGLVPTVEGDWSRLAPDVPRDAVLGWALREAARHPGRYAASVIERLKYALSFEPLLIGLWLAAAVLAFRRREHRWANILALGFLLVHCLPSIERRYLFPLWPLLWALALAGAASLLPGEEPRDPGRLARRLVALGVGGALAFGLLAETLVLRYPGRVKAKPEGPVAALSEVLSRLPKDPWLLAVRARWLLREGRTGEAERDLLAAAALRPEDPNLRLRLAVLELRRGRAEPLLKLGSQDPGRVQAGALQLWLAAGKLARGDSAGAKERLEAAYQAWWEQRVRVRRQSTALEREAFEKLGEGAYALFVRETTVWLSQHSGLDKALMGKLARELLEEAPEDEEVLSSAALFFQELGDFPRALALHRKLAPRSAVFLKNLGVCEWLSGDAKGAERRLREALRREPGLLSAALSLGFVYSKQGRSAEARGVYEAALGAAPAPGEAALRPALEEALIKQY